MFGMMDNAYFTGKSEIIRWINENVEPGEDVRVLNVFGRFAGGKTIHETEFTH